MQVLLLVLFDDEAEVLDLAFGGCRGCLNPRLDLLLPKIVDWLFIFLGLAVKQKGRGIGL